MFHAILKKLTTLYHFLLYLDEPLPRRKQLEEAKARDEEGSCGEKPLPSRVIQFASEMPIAMTLIIGLGLGEMDIG